MAKQRRDRRARSRRRGAQSQDDAGISFSLPYDQRNWIAMGLGLVVVAIGYWFLSQPPVDGVMSLTIAPILLVLGYCVLIPAGLLLGKTRSEQDVAEADASQDSE